MDKARSRGNRIPTDTRSKQVRSLRNSYAQVAAVHGRFKPTTAVCCAATDRLVRASPKRVQADKPLRAASLSAAPRRRPRPQSGCEQTTMAPFWQQTTTTTTQPPAAREWYDYPGRILAWYQRGGAPPPEPPPYSRNWHNSGVFLTALLVVCATLGAGTMGLLHEDTYPRRLTRLLTDAGVAFQRTARTIQEIERKLFHCLGLLVPWGYYTLSTTYNYPKETCVYLCVAITLLGICFDLLRIRVFPAINDLAFVQKLLRSEERDTLCGCSFFAVGNSMAIMLARRPAVAVTALMYLTLGDTAAALVGVAFGAHPIKISKTKKKSIEGSLAMFAVCFTSCSIMLADVTLVEYVAVFSALVATLVELYAPCGVNDNLAIPVLSVVALDFALQRVGAYG